MANTYLTRSLSSTSTSWTFSAWVKRGSNLGVTNYFISWGNSGTDATGIGFNTSDKFQYYSEDNPSNINAVSNGVYRDTSGWYNFVCSCNAGAITLYTNGETVGSTTGGNALDTSTMAIGKWVTSAYYHDGSMSHVNFIDGTAYDATAFGETDATTGEWKIKTSPSVTYGTNGFFILKDGNSVTDQSTNTNNFTVGGGTLTNTEDSPSNVFAVMNNLDTYNSPTITNGNTVINAGASDKSLRSTLGFSQGKYYWEVKIIPNNSAYLGIINSEKALAVGYDLSVASTNSVVFNANGGELKKNGSTVATYSTSGNATYGFAFDLDAGTLKLSKDGVFFNSGNAVVTGISADTYLPLFAPNGGGSPTEFQVNFGNGYFGTTAVSSAGTNASGIGIFEHDVPENFTALSTKGLNL